MRKKHHEQVQIQDHFDAMQVLLDDLRANCLAYHEDPSSPTAIIDTDLILMQRDIQQLRSMLHLPIPSPMQQKPD